MYTTVYTPLIHNRRRIIILDNIVLIGYYTLDAFHTLQKNNTYYIRLLIG